MDEQELDKKACLLEAKIRQAQWKNEWNQIIKDFIRFLLAEVQPQKPDEAEKGELDKWLITAMSHMKTIYEDNNIPWSAEDERKFQVIRQLLI